MSDKLHFEMRLYPRQLEAFQVLDNQETRELLYGGAAGGAKTWLGCCWQIYNRLAYAGTKGFIGRARLKNLRHTTLSTFFRVAASIGLKQNIHYKYHQELGLIKFVNGSEILLRHLQESPSDPDFTALGGLEITDAFIDEASEVSEKAVHIVASRIRFGLDKSGLPPKILLCSNPSRNWLYRNFYEPSINGTLPKHRKFIQALVHDNHTKGFAESYVQQLENLDTVSKQRLLEGLWDYADDVLNLFLMETLANLTSVNIPKSTVYFLSADIARFGNDATVIGLWSGLQLVDIFIMEKSSLSEAAAYIKTIMSQYHIMPSKVIIDSDGIGAGVVDNLPAGVIQFMAQHKPIVKGTQTAAFSSLKAQCYYSLSQAVQAGKLGVHQSVADRLYKNKAIIAWIQEDLLAVRRTSEILEGKLSINSKSHQKQLLGRSPDFGDMLMMRQYFELRPSAFAFS